MIDELDVTQGGADWTRGMRGCLTWGIPIAILVLGPNAVLSWYGPPL